jgi:DNA (cytosine-5)-methyltransferase 1
MTGRIYAGVSLFAGCGGMDLGAEMTQRIQVVWANDNEHWAVETYRRNLGMHILEGDIRAIDVPDVPCDILLAGPPCQDFSTLWNHDGAKTARGNLFREVARFLSVMQPPAFVLENVPGLLSANRGAAWTIVRHALRSPGSFVTGSSPGLRYSVSAQVVDMADLGVPQHRDRLIVLGIRRDLAARPPSIPMPAAERHVTVAEALDAVPIPDDAPNHERNLDSPEVVERLRMIPPGSNYEIIPDGHPLAVRGLISHVYRRLDPEAPAYTMIANGGGGTHGYHHREPRRLSNREKARLQSFPDDFVFEHGTDSRSPHSARSAYPRVRKQIGNAVPPVAAKVIVDAVADTLREADLPGRLTRDIASARRRTLNLARGFSQVERNAAVQ